MLFNFKNTLVHLPGKYVLTCFQNFLQDFYLLAQCRSAGIEISTLPINLVWVNVSRWLKQMVHRVKLVRSANLKSTCAISMFKKIHPTEQICIDFSDAHYSYLYIFILTIYIQQGIAPTSTSRKTLKILSLFIASYSKLLDL